MCTVKHKHTIFKTYLSLPLLTVISSHCNFTEQIIDSINNHNRPCRESFVLKSLHYQGSWQPTIRREIQHMKIPIKSSLHCLEEKFNVKLIDAFLLNDH